MEEEQKQQQQQEAFVLWCEEDDHLISISSSFNKLLKKFHEWRRIKQYGNDDVVQLIEMESIQLSRIHPDDSKIYYTKISNLNANKPIYVLKCQESSEGMSFHDSVYYNMSNSKKTIYEIATEYFIQNSENTEQKDIQHMLHGLKKNNSYDIPEGRGYVCDMDLFLFKKKIS